MKRIDPWFFASVVALAACSMASAEYCYLDTYDNAAGLGCVPGPVILTCNAVGNACVPQNGGPCQGSRHTSRTVRKGTNLVEEPGLTTIATGADVCFDVWTCKCKWIPFNGHRCGLDPLGPGASTWTAQHAAGASCVPEPPT